MVLIRALIYQVEVLWSRLIQLNICYLVQCYLCLKFLVLAFPVKMLLLLLLQQSTRHFLTQLMIIKSLTLSASLFYHLLVTEASMIHARLSSYFIAT